MSLVRNAILLALLVLAVTFVAATLSLLQEPDSDGKGRDSYGTQAGGYRGLHDVFSELGIPVERRVHPPKSPAAADLAHATIAFLEPDPGLTGVEPTYLRGLLPWVEKGGRLVVATSRLVPWMSIQGDKGLTGSPPTILESLDLADVKLLSRSMRTGTVSAPQVRNPWKEPETVSKSVIESWAKAAALEPPVPVAVRGEGTLAGGDWPLHELVLPGESVGCLDIGNVATAGRVVALPDAKDGSFVLAAEFPRGEGRIVLLADPALLANRLVARGDNSLLAARLLAPSGGPVLLDEFYHGLSVRGNPLFLLTQPGYMALALGLLICSGLVVWREAIFLGPPLPDDVVQRRDIGEYVSAMARFFSTGWNSRPDLVRQLRSGVLRELSGELSLPPETHDVELVAAALCRTNPPRGNRMREAFRETDRALDERRSWTETQTLDAMRRLTACLSKRA